MGKKIQYILLTLMILVCSSIIDPSQTLADGEVATSMFVSPMVDKLELEPGENYEGIIEISNAANAVYNLEYLAKVGSYKTVGKENGKDDYGTIETAQRSNHNMMVDWINIENPNGIIEPNGTIKVKYEINVPENAPSGSQYATLLVNDITKLPGDETSDSNNIAIENKLQIIVSLFANISGDTLEKGAIFDNSISSFLINGPLEATSMVRNEGNIYTDAEYTLQVWPLFSDEEICTNEENPDTSLVLPDTERYHTQSCNLPAVGIFKAKQIVRIFGEESIVEKTVIVCPIWLLFIMIFAIFALIFYFIAKARARKKTTKKVNI